MASGSRPQNPADARSIQPKGHGAKTLAVRDRAVTTLLSETTIAKAAKRCGVNERTLRRWLIEDEAFKLAYESARQATFQDAMNRIQVITTRAVETLEDLLSAKKHPSVRLGAARTIVELGLHRHDSETIMRKLREVEAYQRDHVSTSGSRGR